MLTPSGTTSNQDSESKLKDSEALGQHWFPGPLKLPIAVPGVLPSVPVHTLLGSDLGLEESLRAQANALLTRLDALVICVSHAWGGLEQVAVSDALDTASQGLKVRFLCLKDSPVYQQLLSREQAASSHEQGKISLIPIPFSPKNYFDLVLRGELLRLLAEGVNLIHTHQTSILGSLVPWLWGRGEVALVATRHIMNDHNKKDFIHRALYRRLDSLMVVSESVRRNILETHPLTGRKVKVVHLGLDFKRFEPAFLSSDDVVSLRSSWGACADTTVIGLVGRIDPAKGQATFIKAAAGLLMGLKVHEKLKFVIIGEETRGSSAQHMTELYKMIKQFGLDDCVVFAGYHTEVPLVMRALDIFTMPSRQEAFGLVAIEAMAMECPVIISRGGSAEEIVGPHSEYGLLTRPDDAFDLQRQLRYLLDHPRKRIEMGQRAREHVKTQYDKRKRILHTLNLYQRALRRRQRVL
jgi:glycosyltransferase involved in cell wall biosynthesis